MAVSTPSMCLRRNLTRSTRRRAARLLHGSAGPWRGRVSSRRPEPRSRWPSIPLRSPRSCSPEPIPAWRSSSSRWRSPRPGPSCPPKQDAALPVLAASLLTREEVVLRNILRIRDVEAMLELLRRLDVKVEWRDENVVAIRPTRSPTGRRPQVGRAHPRFVPAGRAAAGALRPRRHAAARRRRDRAASPRSAPRRLPGARRRRRLRPLLRARARARRSACDFFMDEPSVMATENALMAAALTRLDRDPQRRRRAARPGPGSPADADGRRIEGIGSN